MLATLAILSTAAIGLYFVKPMPGAHGGWVGNMLEQSTARYHPPHGGHAAPHAAAMPDIRNHADNRGLSPTPEAAPASSAMSASGPPPRTTYSGDAEGFAIPPSAREHEQIRERFGGGLVSISIRLPQPGPDTPVSSDAGPAQGGDAGHADATTPSGGAEPSGAITFEADAGPPLAALRAKGPSFYGLGDPHKVMYFVSAVFGLIGIAAAAWFHLLGRTESGKCRMDALAARLGPIPRWAENKWYVDELYDFLFRTPLLVAAHIFHLIDRLLVDGLVNLFGWIPRALGGAVRPSQSGQLNAYAVGMAGGLAILLVIVMLTVL